MIKQLRSYFVAFGLFLVGLYHGAYAASEGNPPPSNGGAGGSFVTLNLQNPLSCGDLAACVTTLTSNLIKISIPIVAIMVVIGGLQIILAAGNSEKVATGRKTVTYAAIGFAIVLVASSIVAVVKSILQ